LVLEEQEKREDFKVAELKDAIQAGIESGPGVPAQEVFDRLEKKYATPGKTRNG
jgi:antitoxin ParD1/3/4